LADPPATGPGSPTIDFRRKMVVVGVLYYAEGLPYGFLFKTLSYYLSTEGLSLAAIGLAGLLHLPWTFKFLWAPLVDRFGPRAPWIISCQVIIAGAMLGLPGLVPGGMLFFGLLTLMAIASATQDVAIDGYTIDLLTPDEQGPANGMRITTYRVALIASGGLAVWVSEYLGWAGAFALMAASLLLVTVMILLWAPARQPRPKAVTETAKRASKSVVAVAKQAWGGIINLPHVWAVILFILLFKAGDAFLGQMVGPFWDRSGYSRAEYGLISGTLGTVLSIAGSLLGGWLCKVWGLGRAVWILGALQAVSNLGYAVAALSPGTAALVYGASMFESITGGLGNGPFLTFLMRICDREVSAAQYAALSAIFALSGTIAASLSGFAAQSLGFASFFSLSFIVALPAFAVLPWVLPLTKQQGAAHLEP
jgi:PAT family beta-lactamase induction signal transducer AmpG